MAQRLRPLLDAAILLLIVSGETLSAFLPAWSQAGPFGGLFVAGVVLLAVRHVLWPQPNIGAVLWRLLVGDGGPARSTIAITVGTRCAVLLAGWLAVSAVGYQLAPGQPRIARSELLNLPARHDAGWYLGIARHGYDWRPEIRDRQQPVAFFPAYPVAMRLGGDLVTVPAKLFAAPRFFENGNARVLWGGVFASWLCVLAAGLRIASLAEREGLGPSRAKWVVALTMCWPFALFFSTAYSEALFLLALAGTLLAWRKGEAGKAAIWGLLCGLTRSNGWTVSVALMADLFLNKASRPQAPAKVLAGLAPVAGTACFSLYIYSLTGSFFAWAAAQRAWGRSVEPVAFIERRWHTINREGFWQYVTRDPSDILTAAAVLIALAAAMVLLKRREWLYGVLIVAYLAPAVLIDLPAAGRMTAVLFPVWFAVAASVRAPALLLVAACAMLLQLTLAARHFVWQPPF